MMKFSNIPVSQTIVAHCKAKQVKHIIISPGSRNAPLTIGFTEDPYFECFSIVDERCAAFFALGIAQQSLSPVAVLCTSGSALLNYYPAIAEAYYSDIPLVVISADRPVYKIDIGDGQTVRQDDVFNRHIGYSANLRQDLSHATDKVKKYRPDWLLNAPLEELQQKVQRFNDEEINNALNLAISSKLPVHINVRLEEPLYGKLTSSNIKLRLQQPTKPSDEQIDLQGFTDVWLKADRKMILVGVNWPNTIDQEILDALANDPSVIVLTETTSNLHHKNFFPSIDSLIAPLEKLANSEALFEQLKPNLLVTFGGMVVSKKIKAFLREYQPEQHWHIDPIRAFDTYFCLSKHLKASPNEVLNKLIKKITPVNESEYYNFWHKVKIGYEAKRKLYFDQIPFCDMQAFNSVIESLPHNCNLQLANSSTVRYAQLYALPTSLNVFCNRGTSGIDGSVSTAIGAAVYAKEPTVLITGDLSFFYDSNALWNNYIRPDFRIIVLNNNGGGIFRILPGKENSENFETYFETIHSLRAKELCKMYGLDYTFANDLNDLKNSLSHFYAKTQKPKLLEISTPRILNNKILLGYFDFISSDVLTINYKSTNNHE